MEDLFSGDGGFYPPRSEGIRVQVPTTNEGEDGIYSHSTKALFGLSLEEDNAVRSSTITPGGHRRKSRTKSRTGTRKLESGKRTHTKRPSTAPPNQFGGADAFMPWLDHDGSLQKSQKKSVAHVSSATVEDGRARRLAASLRGHNPISPAARKLITRGEGQMKTPGSYKERVLRQKDTLVLDGLAPPLEVSHTAKELADLERKQASTVVKQESEYLRTQSKLQASDEMQSILESRRQRRAQTAEPRSRPLAARPLQISHVQVTGSAFDSPGGQYSRRGAADVFTLDGDAEQEVDPIERIGLNITASPVGARCRTAAPAVGGLKRQSDEGDSGTQVLMLERVRPSTMATIAEQRAAQEERRRQQSEERARQHAEVQERRAMEQQAQSRIKEEKMNRAQHVADDVRREKRLMGMRRGDAQSAQEEILRLVQEERERKRGQVDAELRFAGHFALQHNAMAFGSKQKPNVTAPVIHQKNQRPWHQTRRAGADGDAHQAARIMARGVPGRRMPMSTSPVRTPSANPAARLARATSKSKRSAKRKATKNQAKAVTESPVVEQKVATSPATTPVTPVSLSLPSPVESPGINIHGSNTKVVTPTNTSPTPPREPFPGPIRHSEPAVPTIEPEPEPERGGDRRISQPVALPRSFKITRPRTSPPKPAYNGNAVKSFVLGMGMEL